MGQDQARSVESHRHGTVLREPGGPEGQGLHEGPTVARQSAGDGHLAPDLGGQTGQDGATVHCDPLGKEEDCGQVRALQGRSEGGAGPLAAGHAGNGGFHHPDDHLAMKPHGSEHTGLLGHTPVADLPSGGTAHHGNPRKGLLEQGNVAWGAQGLGTAEDQHQLGLQLSQGRELPPARQGGSM